MTIKRGINKGNRIGKNKIAKKTPMIEKALITIMPILPKIKVNKIAIERTMTLLIPTSKKPTVVIIASRPMPMRKGTSKCQVINNKRSNKMATDTNFLFRKGDSFIIHSSV